MATNDTPLSIDFLSDPASTLSAIQKVSAAMEMLHTRTTKLVAAFKHLDGAVKSDTAAASLQKSTSAAESLNATLAKAITNSKALNTSLSQTPAQKAGGAGIGGGEGSGGSTLVALGKGALMASPFVAIAAGAKAATGAAMDYEQAMAAVAAVGDLSKTSKEFKMLQEATQSGSKQFSATEKALGLRELVAAGLSAKEATGALNNTLVLATAGEMSMSRAAEILTSSMAAFDVGAEDSMRVVDVLAKAANSSLASIDSMGEAMKFAAPIANGLGISLEDASAAMALLAKYGVQGGMAGRGFGAVMARLVAPSKDAEAALAEFGLTAADVNPQVVGMATSLGRLGRVSQETLVKLFGAENLDVSNIFSKNSSELDHFRQEMDNAAGAGQRFANAVADSSTGRLKATTNQVHDLAIEVGNLGKALLDAGLEPFSGFLDYVDAGVKAARTATEGKRFTALEAAVLNIEGANKPVAPKPAAMDAGATAEVFWANQDAAERARKARREALRENQGPSPADGNAFAQMDAAQRVAESLAERTKALREYNSELSISEARASGNSALADKLELELKFLREKKKLMELFDMGDADATALAQRSITASSASARTGFNGVADSLRSIGGGGNFFAGGAQSLQQQQLRVQEQIRDAILNSKNGALSASIVN